MAITRYGLVGVPITSGVSGGSYIFSQFAGGEYLKPRKTQYLKKYIAGRTRIDFSKKTTKNLEDNKIYLNEYNKLKENINVYIQTQTSEFTF